ncbi:MAG: spore cortex biosynthesis protein YabQ [Clostridia bacterium]|nr:spore cortex biosynthesis protein YabQ [Clostridia bacterium]
MGYIDVTQQMLTFAMSVLLGVVLCFIYDIVRALHRVALKGFLEVLICDILFWVTSAVLTFCFLLIRCNGMVRAYVLFGESVGVLFAHYTVSRFWYAILLKLFGVLALIKRVFKTVFVKVSVPFKKIFKNLIKTIKKVLQHNCRLLYNQLKVCNRTRIR